MAMQNITHMEVYKPPPPPPAFLMGGTVWSEPGLRS